MRCTDWEQQPSGLLCYFGACCVKQGVKGRCVRRVCVCVYSAVKGGRGCREHGMFGLFSNALSGCRGACEPSFGVRGARLRCDDSGGGGEV